MSPQADFEILEHLLQPMALGPLPETPLVSVLMANFNYARYVGAAIESVLNQTYGNLEVVVCDDGSTDISCEVISTYMQRDRRVRLIRKPNGGHASVLNAAFASSRGQIISLLDSDDMFCEDKLAKIIETFRQAPAAGFVMHRVTAFNGAGESLYVTPFGLHPEGWLGVSLALGNRPSGMPPCSGMSLRREVAERVFLSCLS